jgi:predicted phage tail protein
MLSWSAPGNGGVPDTYVIEAGSTSGGADLANFSAGTTATTFSASNVRAGTYYVRVRAGNAVGTGAPSNEVTIVVGGGGCSVAPGAPSNLAVVSGSGGTVVLGWTAADGTPASYIVEAGSGPGGTNLTNSDLGSAATSLTATGLARGGYFVRIRARNQCGVSPASNEVIVNVP